MVEFIIVLLALAGLLFFVICIFGIVHEIIQFVKLTQKYEARIATLESAFKDLRKE